MKEQAIAYLNRIEILEIVLIDYFIWYLEEKRQENYFALK